MAYGIHEALVRGKRNSLKERFAPLSDEELKAEQARMRDKLIEWQIANTFGEFTAELVEEAAIQAAVGDRDDPRRSLMALENAERSLRLEREWKWKRALE